MDEKLRLQTYIHENGRRCIWFQNRWLHFDHDHLPAEPGPRDVVDYACRMDHWIAEARWGTLITDAERDELAGAPTGRIMGQLMADIEQETPVVNEEPLRTTGVWTITDHGLSVDHGEVGYTVPAVTKLAQRIIKRHMPQALEHFLNRNAEYGEDNDFNLGVRGQYVDISRKVQKLKRRWWDGQGGIESGVGVESDRVVVMELIGHLLMALDMLAEGDGSEAQG